MLLATTGCDRVKRSLRPDNSDPRWQGDSALLAAKPEFLFRMLRDSTGERVFPMATVGSLGFRPIAFGDRGWRAFDLLYLQKGTRLTSYHEGVATGATEMTRGMWDPPTDPLDTLPGCPVVVPSGKATVSQNTWLLTSGKRPPLKPVTPLSSAELQAALSTVSTLVAPTSGIAGAILAKYRREVFVVASGIGSRPSIVVLYDDPESLSDTVASIAQRPRQLVVVLDRGVYGFRPSYTFTTLGNRRAAPRIRFLDYLDVDGDGRAELFFGLRNPRPQLYTIVLRFENENWREILRFEGNRCQF